MIMTSTPPTKQIPSIKEIFPDSQPKSQNTSNQGGSFSDANPQEQREALTNQLNIDAQARQPRAESFLTASLGSLDASKSNLNTGPSRDPPRKRSKISRACDACRRKKIKCNAEYSTTLSKVTQICNNCQKNGDECTFSRTPLKRGPSKGYLKEFEDREEEGTSGYTPPQPTANLNGNVAQPQPVNVYNTNPLGDRRQSQPQQVPQQQQFPQNSLPFPQIRPNSQQMSTIKLPPIIGYNQKATSPAIHKVITANFNESNPSSPPVQQNTASTVSQPPNNNSNNNSPPIQGPFWKVPYEMPRASGPHRSSISSVTSGGGTSRRRSSIDSISSTSTTNTKLPILRHSNNSEFLSDSESEDFYSVRSSSSHRPPIMRNNSQSISPRNSVTSLSSLSGRVNKSMVLQGAPISPMTVSKAGTPYNGFIGQELSRSQLQLQIPPGGFNQLQSSPMDMLKADLDVYDKVFAPAYPVIPVETEKLVQMIQTAGMEAPTENLVECFHISVNDLVNFKTVAEYTTISMFFKLQQLYQQSRVNRVSTFLYALTLVILNYSLLLKGTHYSLGVATAAAFLNDLNAVDRVFDEKLNDKLFDLWFAKLYLTLDIIDNIASLKEGVQKTVASGNSPRFVDKNRSVLNDFVYQTHIVSAYLFKVRNNLLTSNVEDVNKPDIKDEFLTHLANLLHHKYKLFELVNESLSEKLPQILETLTATILNFANYLSTTTMSNKQVLNPCLNLSIDQLFYTIKLVKTIVDNTSDEATKINGNLSISYNLLNLNLANLQLNEQTIRQIKQKIVENPLDFSTKSGPNPGWLSTVIPMIKSDLMR